MLSSHPKWHTSIAPGGVGSGSGSISDTWALFSFETATSRKKEKIVTENETRDLSSNPT